VAVSLIKATGGAASAESDAGAGAGPLRTIGGQPVQKITDASVIRMSGRVDRVTVRPGLFSGSVSMIRYRDGRTELRASESGRAAVVQAWLRLAVGNGVFLGFYGVR